MQNHKLCGYLLLWLELLVPRTTYTSYERSNKEKVFNFEFECTFFRQHFVYCMRLKVFTGYFMGQKLNRMIFKPKG